MKRVISPVLFATEGGLLYLWQFQGQLAAGRVLVFYLWTLAIALIVVGVLALIGAVWAKTRTEIQEQGVLARCWGWATVSTGRCSSTMRCAPVFTASESPRTRIARPAVSRRSRPMLSYCADSIICLGVDGLDGRVMLVGVGPGGKSWPEDVGRGGSPARRWRR